MLLGGPHNPLDALARANALSCPDWNRDRYTADSRVLVLSGGQGARWGYLMLAEPSYMRLPNHLGSARFELPTPAEARRSGELRGAAAKAEGLVVRIHSRGGRFVVTCRELGFLAHGQSGLVSRSPSRNRRAHGTDLEQGSGFETHLRGWDQLPLLDGATLSWHWLNVGLGTFVLRADAMGASPQVAMFLGTELVDLPQTVTGARMRLASRQESQAARAGLTGEWAEVQGVRDPPRLLMVTAEEGTFHLWASVLMPVVRLAAESSDRERVRGPLWEGGPALEELYQPE